MDPDAVESALECVQAASEALTVLQDVSGKLRTGKGKSGKGTSKGKKGKKGNGKSGKKGAGVVAARILGR